jgi:dihydrodipicolinate synthase/N-acetylneuraminate lyase
MERVDGLFCALWTPTDQDGEVLWEALDQHLDAVTNSGIQGIMALGSTGEFVHLTPERRKELLGRILFACHKRGMRLIANVSDVQIRNVIDLARCARNAGADYFSVLPPWFFPLEQRDLAEFFVQVSRAAEVPLILYNFPEVAGKKIELETIRSVARRTRVLAIKQSGADFQYHHDLVELGRELGFVVLTGADTRLEETLRFGCAGAISGLANAVPEIFARIWNNFKAGVESPAETALVADLARRIAPLSFPLNVKATIAARGFDTGASKFAISPQTQAIYDGVVDDLRTWFASAAFLSLRKPADGKAA